MAKITVSRLFELSKFLATNSGKELRGVLEYLAEFAEVTLRTLRNGISFQDNINCQLRSVAVVSSTATIVAPSGKRVSGVLVQRSESSVYYIIDKFGWSYTSDGDLSIYCSMVDSSGSSPSASTAVNVDLILLFG